MDDLKTPKNGSGGPSGGGSSGGGASGGGSTPGGAGLGYDIDGYDKYYCYLPGKFILQWGRLNNWKIHGSNNGTMTYVTFPIPFPNKCMSLVVSVEDWNNGSGSGCADNWSTFNNLTNIGANMGMDHNGSAWIAIGN